MLGLGRGNGLETEFPGGDVLVVEPSELILGLLEVLDVGGLEVGGRAPEDLSSLHVPDFVADLIRSFLDKF